MTVDKKAIVTPNSWASLRRHTDARIGLGRSGISLPTQPQLEFQQAHARARDAVHIPLEVVALEQGLANAGLQSVRLHSQASDRATYLQRPDKGRRLDADSAALLKQLHARQPPRDATIVIADGLSSTAVQRHAAIVAAAVDQRLAAVGLTRTPICIVQQGRVAVGDEVGELLESRLLILLVGERPGLSSPDSLGIYYTYNPRVGLTDASRNCISNVRPAGIVPEEAAERLMWLVNESLTRKLSGVDLKDKSGDADALEGNGQRNFLLE
ncbi:MAG: ethanolamine ammonia-lyase subunit EutC [Oceanospirillales bacterium]|nr:ethanolamine ammonia-lyase subunit EutC [Oceanospirillales bacterium]